MNETILANLHQKSYFPLRCGFRLRHPRRLRQLIYMLARQQRSLPLHQQLSRLSAPPIKVASLYTSKQTRFSSLIISHVQLHRSLKRDDLQSIIVDEGTGIGIGGCLETYCCNLRLTIDCVLDFHNGLSLGPRTRQSLSFH